MKTKKDETTAPVLYADSFIQKRLVKYFHYLQPRENKRLIHLIILINTVRLNGSDN